MPSPVRWSGRTQAGSRFASQGRTRFSNLARRNSGSLFASSPTLAVPHARGHGYVGCRAVESRCPQCGTAVEEGQIVCVECGARLNLVYGKTPSPLLPAGIVGAVVLLAGIGLAI